MRVLVVGAGTAGLRTALELARLKIPVVLRAPKHFLDASNCSQGAGGLWMPFHCDDVRTSAWALETLSELWDILRPPRRQNLVELVPAIVLLRDHHGPSVDDFTAMTYELKLGGSTVSTKVPAWTVDPRLEFQHLAIEMLHWQNHVYQLRIPPQDELISAGYKYAWFFQAPIVNAPNMLEHYYKQLQDHCDINVKTGHSYECMEEMCQVAKNLDCNVLINCTGMGAKAIRHDPQLIPARGILHLYNRATCPRRMEISPEKENDAVIMTSEAPWGSESEPAYLIPRGERILVGGSYLEGDTAQSIRPHEQERLVRNANLLGIDTQQCQHVEEWVGFRPYRPTVCCEVDAVVDRATGVRTAHCYGFGGSGWTINAGAARHVVDLLLQSVLD